MYTHNGCIVETLAFTKRTFTNVCTNEIFEIPLSDLEIVLTVLLLVLAVSITFLAAVFCAGIIRDITM